MTSPVPGSGVAQRRRSRSRPGPTTSRGCRPVASAQSPAGAQDPTRSRRPHPRTAGEAAVITARKGVATWEGIAAIPLNDGSAVAGSRLRFQPTTTISEWTPPVRFIRVTCPRCSRLAVSRAEEISSRSMPDVDLKSAVYKDERPKEYFDTFHERTRAGPPGATYEVVRAVTVLLALTAFRARGIDSGNVPAGPLILAPNHASNMDHFFTAAFIRRRIQFMAKSQLFGSSPMSWVYTHGGVFPVRRGDQDEVGVHHGVQHSRPRWCDGDVLRGHPVSDRRVGGIGEAGSRQARARVRGSRRAGGDPRFSSGPELEANAVPEGDGPIRSAVQIRCCCRDDTGSASRGGRLHLRSDQGASLGPSASGVHIGASVACRRRPQVSDAMPTRSSAPARMTATRVTASISPGAATHVSLMVLDQPGSTLCGGSRPAARSETTSSMNRPDFRHPVTRHSSWRPEPRELNT